MQCKLTIPERLKDLRTERKLTLEQLAEATGLSRSALSKYEADDFKDISPFSIAALAQFYGVSTDYLLGLTEQKNHPDTGIEALHLSDEMLDILRGGKINNRLLCEIATHHEFSRLLLDIEVYVDRIAGMQIDNLNAAIATARAEILMRKNPEENERTLRALELAYIQENDFFTHIVHEDMDTIIADIRETHKKDRATAESETTATKLKQAIDDAMEYEGTDQEKQMRIYCNLFEIPCDDMLPEEFEAVLHWLRRSKVLQSVAAQNMRSKVQMTHGKGKGKRKKP